MKNKYYTPKLNEFHIGFEYEYEFKIGVWKKSICTKSDFNSLEYHIGLGVRRVKYLNQEDIESFGYHTEDNGECYIKSIGWMNIHIYPWGNVGGREHEYKIAVDMSTVFHGIIKNKSELEKLLNQLNIK